MTSIYLAKKWQLKNFVKYGQKCKKYALEKTVTFELIFLFAYDNKSYKITLKLLKAHF